MARRTHIITATAAVLALAGCGGAASSSSSSSSAAGSSSTSAAGTESAAGSGATSASAPSVKKVKGTIKPSLLISGDKEAIKSLVSKGVACWWEDGKVHMQATFTNGMNAHITVHVQPNYRLKKAGLHGDGVSSQEDVGIDSGATRKWTAELGTPDGVKGTPAITECAPEINSVDLG